jgi:hypothetical protein
MRRRPSSGIFQRLATYPVKAPIGEHCCRHGIVALIPHPRSTMKTNRVLVFTFCSLITGGNAVACTITEPQRDVSNNRETVSGACSNNGAPVTCTHQQGEGWTCIGPEGSFSSLAGPETALGSACGCDTTPRW